MNRTLPTKMGFVALRRNEPAFSGRLERGDTLLYRSAGGRGATCRSATSSTF